MIEQKVCAIVINGVRTDKWFVFERSVFDDKRQSVNAKTVDTDVQPKPEYVLSEENTVYIFITGDNIYKNKIFIKIFVSISKLVKYLHFFH